jgi:hypothetical protein
MLPINRALTVLVVAHNNAKTLLPTVERVYRALTITVEDFSILIFDDASTDGTFAAAEAAAREYPFVPVRRSLANSQVSRVPARHRSFRSLHAASDQRCQPARRTTSHHIVATLVKNMQRESVP